MCEYLHTVHAVIPPEKLWKIYIYWKILENLQHRKKKSATRALRWCKFYVDSSRQTYDTGCGLFLLQVGTHICSHSFSITVKMVVLPYMKIHLLCTWYWSFAGVSHLSLVSESGGVLCSTCFCTQATFNWRGGHHNERHCSGPHGSWYLWHEWTCEWTGTDMRWSILEWVHFSRLVYIYIYIYIYLFNYLYLYLYVRTDQLHCFVTSSSL
jgi:hypothetical protein